MTKKFDEKHCKYDHNNMWAKLRVLALGRANLYPKSLDKSETPRYTSVKRRPNKGIGSRLWSLRSSDKMSVTGG